MSVNTLPEVRERYEEWHSALGTASSALSDLETPWYAWAKRVLPELAGKSVLEIACGRGALVDWMTHRGARVAGCDISHTALRSAQSGFRGNFAQTDIHGLPFADHSFDVVVSCETLEHTLDIDSAIRELVRVTRPGGTILISTPNYLNVYGLYRVYVWMRGRPYASCGIQPVERILLSIPMMVRLRRLGLRIRSTEGLLHYLIPARTRLRFVESSPMLSRLMKHFALHFAIVAEVGQATNQ